MLEIHSEGLKVRVAPNGETTVQQNAHRKWVGWTFMGGEMLALKFAQLLTPDEVFQLQKAGLKNLPKHWEYQLRGVKADVNELVADLAKTLSAIVDGGVETSYLSDDEYVVRDSMQKVIGVITIVGNFVTIYLQHIHHAGVVLGVAHRHAIADETTVPISFARGEGQISHGIRVWEKPDVIAFIQSLDERYDDFEYCKAAGLSSFLPSDRVLRELVKNQEVVDF